jgi:hypothetical protein
LPAFGDEHPASKSTMIQLRSVTRGIITTAIDQCKRKRIVCSV